MKKSAYILLIILASCGKKYQEIQESDLEQFTSISEVWEDKEGNRLLYAYTDNGAIASGRDWIYEKNHASDKKYFLIDRSNGFYSPLNISYFEDSLILLHESESTSAPFSEWWIKVTSSSSNEREFDHPDKAITEKFDKDYLNQLSDGVFKVHEDTLVQVCDYKKFSEWSDIAELGSGTYYFAKTW